MPNKPEDSPAELTPSILMSMAQTHSAPRRQSRVQAPDRRLSKKGVRVPLSCNDSILIHTPLSSPLDIQIPFPVTPQQVEGMKAVHERLRRGRGCRGRAGAQITGLYN